MDRNRRIDNIDRQSLIADARMHLLDDLMAIKTIICGR